MYQFLISFCSICINFIENIAESICPFLYHPAWHMFLFYIAFILYLDVEKRTHEQKRRIGRRVDSQLVNPIDYQQPLSFLLTFLQQQHINFLQNMLQYLVPTIHWFIYRKYHSLIESNGGIEEIYLLCIAILSEFCLNEEEFQFPTNYYPSMKEQW